MCPALLLWLLSALTTRPGKDTTRLLANISDTSVLSVTIADNNPPSHRRLECVAPAASGLFPDDDYAASTRRSLM